MSHQKFWNRVLSIMLLLSSIQPMGTAEAQTHSDFNLDYFNQLLRDGLKASGKNDFKQAEQIFQQAIGYATTQHAPDVQIANADGLLGELYLHTGRNEDAERLLVSAISKMEMTIPPLRESVAIFSNSLGVVYAHQGRYQKAVQTHEKAIKLYETYLNNSQSFVRMYPLILSNLSAGYQELAQYQNAQRDATTALDFARRHPGKHKTFYISMLLQTSWTYIYQGNYSQAERMIHEAVALLHKSDVAMLSRAQSYLAWVSGREGNYGEAENLYDKTLETNKRLYGKYSTAYITDLISKGKILLEQDKFDQAKPIVQEAEMLMQTASSAPLRGDLLYELGKLAQHDKNFAAAEEYFNQAIETEKSVTGAIHRHQVRYYYGLAELYAEQGKRDSAILNYKEAIAMQQKIAPETHPDLAMLQNKLNNYLSNTSPDNVIHTN